MDREALDRITLRPHSGCNRHDRGLKVIVEDLVPVFYKGKPLNGCYRIDLLVEDAVIVEFEIN